MTTNEQKPANAPDYHAFHVPERDKPHWTRIGAAWNHRDGEDLTLHLELMPLGGGRIVLRRPDTPPPATEEGAGA
jgi:hypothetical protein